MKEHAVIFECRSRKKMDAAFEVSHILKRILALPPSWCLSPLSRTVQIQVLGLASTVTLGSDVLGKDYFYAPIGVWETGQTYGERRAVFVNDPKAQSN